MHQEMACTRAESFVIRSMDVSVCPFKPLLREPIEDVEFNGTGDQSDPLLEREEEQVEGGVSEAGLIRSGSSLLAYLPKAKFGERDRRNVAVVRRNRSTDKAALALGEYQPIVDVWDTDAEEEHLISQHMPRRSNSKVRSILEACRRLLGMAL